MSKQHGGHPKYVFSFRLDTSNQHVKFFMEIEHNIRTNSVRNIFSVLEVTNMATEWNFEVISDKFNVDHIYT